MAAVSVAQSTREFREVRGQRMIAVAENMASTPIVRDRFADPFAARVLAPEADRAVALSGAGLAEILDPSGTVRVSSDPSRIGHGWTWGPAGPTRAARGSATTTSTACTAWSARCRSCRRTATCSPSCRSASAIRRCGNCSAARARRLLLYLGLGAALGLLASWLLSRRIKRHTRGLEVAEIAGLADHREALLHSIREGVVAVNNEGVITCSTTARRSFSASAVMRSGAAPTASGSIRRWSSSCSPGRTAATL